MKMNRQLANLSSLTNDATVQQDIESSNKAFEYVNPHSKHLEVKISQYSYGNMYFCHNHSLYAEKK